MRALFTSTPGYGHFLPLTPIARALANAGHDVVFGAPRELRSAVEAAGFRWIKAGVEDDDPELIAVRTREHESHGIERIRVALGGRFVGVLARRMVPDLLAFAEEWRPDLFVRESAEFGSLIAAEILDVPHAKVEVLASGRHTTALLEDDMQRLRRTFGLDERPIEPWLDQYLVLMPFPAFLRTGEATVAPTTHHLRALPADAADAALPAWIGAIGTRPLIYVSLGTEFGDRRGPVFTSLLAGLCDVDAEIVVTLGRDLDPAVFGPQPAHIHLERYLPLRALLPHCALVLFHGGSGTLVHVIAHGLPMVFSPFLGDQVRNAARCQELGASRTLDQEHLTPEHIREVVLDVLQTASYRQVAERLRDDFNALPGPEFVVDLLERLARDKAPVFASG
jgi:UDP:flavonoid glycosyltransferase YjiC (YdhE family)